MDFKESTGLYLIAGGVILFVLAQSIFFLVKAWKQGKVLGIDKKRLLNAVTSSALFTIPSALSILATVIALAPSLGLVIPWVRLSVLGNLMYETTAAENAMEGLGHAGGTAVEVTDPAVFAGIAWVMTLGICFSLVLLPFVAKPLHKKMLSLGKKDETKEMGYFIFWLTFILFLLRSLQNKKNSQKAYKIKLCGLLFHIPFHALLVFRICRSVRSEP